MKIRLDQVVDAAYDWQEQVVLAADELDHPDILELGVLSCRGRLAPVGSDHLLRGEVSYRQTLRCTRCLEPFDAPASAEIGCIVQVGGADLEGGERELEEKELGYVRLQEPELDTRPLWVEQIQLGVPMKPLCRMDCAGLCSECGANLNAGSCDCGPARDPRWAALVGLKNTSSPADEH